MSVVWEGRERGGKGWVGSWKVQFLRVRYEVRGRAEEMKGRRWWEGGGGGGGG